MIEVQILSRVLIDKDYGLLKNNGLTEEYFVGYEEEYNFIIEHVEHYGNVPDEATFLSKFEDFPLAPVQESNHYLLDTIYEQNLFNECSVVMNKAAEMMATDANRAVEYFKGELPRLQIRQSFSATDIVGDAEKRLIEYMERRGAVEDWHIPSGFDELDKITNGFSRGEELAVLFARTGEGKSWVLAKMLATAWEKGNRVGYLSPEMTPNRIGYRFDTLVKNFSNRALVKGFDTSGNGDVPYVDYIKDLQSKENPFFVATPEDFQKRVTVSKLRSFVLANDLQMLGIDGITYLTDERGKNYDNKTTTLTNISEDLMQLSLELQIPIIVVVQSNRDGVRKGGDDGTPDLENIRDSDGIAHNATKVFSIRQTGDGLEIGVKKHRDGPTGGAVVYYWDIDVGEFTYIPDDDDVEELRGGNKPPAARPKTKVAKKQAPAPSREEVMKKRAGVGEKTGKDVF